MAQLGNARRCYIGTSLNGGWVWLTGEQSNNFNRSGNLVEVSDKSTVWQKFISGIRGATASVTVHTDDEDPQQKAAIEALHNGETVFVFIGSVTESNDTVTPAHGDAFEALVNEIDDTNDNGSVASRNISLTANGEPVHYPSIN